MLQDLLSPVHLLILAAPVLVVLVLVAVAVIVIRRARSTQVERIAQRTAQLLREQPRR